MNIRISQAHAIVAALALLSITCGGAARQPAGDNALQNRPAPDSPAASAIDKDAVTRALQARMAALHHSAVRTLDIALHPRPDGAAQGFYLYAFSTFESWQGQRRAEGKLDSIVAAVEKADAECRDEHERAVSEAQQEYERLEAIAEQSGDPDDRQAADDAAMEHEQTLLDSPECNAWTTVYPEAASATLCNPDVLVLVAFTARQPAAAAGPEITEIARETHNDCLVDDSDYPTGMYSGDHDHDGKPEVLWIMAENEHVEMGRGEVRRVTRGLRAEVFDHTLGSSQYGWSVALEPDAEGREGTSVINRIWLADRNRDGHPDLIHREVGFDGPCACDDQEFQALVNQQPRGLGDSWVPMQEITVCNDTRYEEDPPCTATGNSLQELLYDPGSDSWQ